MSTPVICLGVFCLVVIFFKGGQMSGTAYIRTLKNKSLIVTYTQCYNIQWTLFHYGQFQSINQKSKMLK